MTTKRLLLCAVILVALSIAIQVDANAEVHAPPTSPCNWSHRMDLEITGDGIWFECVCEALQMGTVCDWYELGPAPDATAARKSWRYVSRRTQRQLAVLHNWPRYLDPPRRIHAPITVKAVSGIATGVATITGKCTDPFLIDDAWAQTHGC